MCSVLYRPAARSGLMSVEAHITPQACVPESTPISGSPGLWLQLSKVSDFKPYTQDMYPADSGIWSLLLFDYKQSLDTNVLAAGRLPTNPLRAS